MSPTPAERLLALWTKANRHERAEGRGWYEHAAMLAQDACGGIGYDAWPHHRTLAVVAAYSPRVPWKRSVELAARTWASGVPGGHTGAVCKAVAALLAGDRPEAVLRGPKVSAFYRALGGDVDACVVDTHMFRAMGLDSGTARYADAERYVRAAAKRACEPVAQFQATVWIVQRGEAW